MVRSIEDKPTQKIKKMLELAGEQGGAEERGSRLTSTLDSPNVPDPHQTSLRDILVDQRLDDADDGIPRSDIHTLVEHLQRGHLGERETLLEDEERDG